MSLPLPYNSKAIFYITVMKRSSHNVLTPIIKYGIEIEKTAKLVIRNFPSINQLFRLT